MCLERLAAEQCKTMSVIMEGPLVADTEESMAGSRLLSGLSVFFYIF